MSNIRTLAKISLLIMGMAATALMSSAMFVVSFGIERVCFNEPNIWISVPEFILGYLSVGLLCKYIIVEASKLK